MEKIEADIQDIIWNISQEMKEIDRNNTDEDYKYWELENVISQLDDAHSTILKYIQ